MTCSGCSAEKDAGARLPRRWKRIGSSVLCGVCVEARYVLRAVTAPVASVDDWPAFRAALKEAWRLSTRASNLVMTELFRADQPAIDAAREAGDKMPRFTPLYLYPLIRARFPEIDSRSATALIQYVTAKYMATRRNVCWTCAASLPNFRYPTSMPVSAQALKVYFDDADRPMVSIRLGEAQWELRLRGGPKFARQRIQLRELANSPDLMGAGSVYQGGPLGRDVMVKVAGRFAKRVGAGREGVLRVHSMAGSMIQAVNVKDAKLWTFHGDELKRLVLERRRRVQRLADDAKFERQPIAVDARQHAAEVSLYHGRAKALTHQLAASIVGYVERRRFAEIEYDDSDRSFCADLPWYDLRLKIEQKAAAAGLVFRSIATSDATPEEAASLEGAKA